MCPYHHTTTTKTQPYPSTVGIVFGTQEKRRKRLRTHGAVACQIAHGLATWQRRDRCLAEDSIHMRRKRKEVKRWIDWSVCGFIVYLLLHHVPKTMSRDTTTKTRDTIAIRVTTTHTWSHKHTHNTPYTEQWYVPNQTSAQVIDISVCMGVTTVPGSRQGERFHHRCARRWRRHCPGSCCIVRASRGRCRARFARRCSRRSAPLCATCRRRNEITAIDQQWVYIMTKYHVKQIVKKSLKNRNKYILETIVKQITYINHKN